MGNKKDRSTSHVLVNYLSQDHINFDSSEIAAIIINAVKSKPSMLIKSLVAEIKNRYSYSISYKKAWIAKQKTLAMEFGDWENSYNHLCRWLQAVQEVVQGQLYNVQDVRTLLMMLKTTPFTSSSASFSLLNLALKASSTSSLLCKWMEHFWLVNITEHY